MKGELTASQRPEPPLARRLLRAATGFLLTALAGGFLTATLVLLSPGFSSDEELLDPRLTEASLQAIRATRMRERSIPSFYWAHLTRVFHGDLGFSRSLQRPVAELIAARLPVTARLMLSGVAGAWLLAFGVAAGVVLCRAPLASGIASSVSGLLFSVPAAVLALVFFYYGGPLPLVLSLILFPKIFQYTRNVLQNAGTLPHVMAAHSRGLTNVHVFFWHIVPVSLPTLIAVSGVIVSTAFSAAIPVEVICDLPGIGQLAWKAALSRDLPLLVNLAFLVVIVAQFGNLFADLAIAALKRRPA